MLFSQKKIRGRTRSGLSLVEFVGCLAAVGGGLALGLTYLGFDIKSMAMDALQQPEILENSYFSGATEEADHSNAKHSELATKTNREPGKQTAQLPASGQTELQNASAKKPIPKADPLAQPSEVDPEIATKAYWVAFTDCIRIKKTRRKKVDSSSGDWCLFDHLVNQKNGHEQIVTKLEKLDDTGVDQRLVAHAHQVLSWHRAGTQLFSRAVDLLTDSPSAGLDGPIAQSWQSAATQLRMEEKLVRVKHAGVAGYLNHTYKSQAPFLPALSP